MEPESPRVLASTALNFFDVETRISRQAAGSCNRLRHVRGDGECGSRAGRRRATRRRCAWCNGTTSSRRSRLKTPKAHPWPRVGFHILYQRDELLGAIMKVHEYQAKELLAKYG